MYQTNGFGVACGAPPAPGCFQVGRYWTNLLVPLGGRLACPARLSCARFSATSSKSNRPVCATSGLSLWPVVSLHCHKQAVVVGESQISVCSLLFPASLTGIRVLSDLRQLLIAEPMIRGIIRNLLKHGAVWCASLHLRCWVAQVSGQSHLTATIIVGRWPWR